MRWIRVALLLALMPLSAPAAAQESAADGEELPYAVLYADADGVTHFRGESLAWSVGSSYAGTHVTELLPAEQVGFLRLDAGLRMDWHPAPRKQFIMVLEGLVEVIAGDGERRSFAPGTVLLVTDTEGQGHQTNVLGDRDLFAVWTPIP